MKWIGASLTVFVTSCAGPSIQPVATASEPMPPVEAVGVSEEPQDPDVLARRKHRISVFTLHLLAGLYGEDHIVKQRWGGEVETLDEGLALEWSEMNGAARERILNPPIPENAVIIDIRVVDAGRKYPAPSSAPNPSPVGKTRYLHEGRVLTYFIGEKEYADLATLQTHLLQVVAQATDGPPPAILAPSANCIMSDIIPVLDTVVAATFVDITFDGDAVDFL